ncbi:hypothetical protein J6590_033275 [Homalodisca vitripennis]|nr:hypothetical protein J6590_033275 [Homalodisca vitripennis]
MGAEKPTFRALAQPSLLKKCLHGKAQNHFPKITSPKGKSAELFYHRSRCGDPPSDNS